MHKTRDSDHQVQGRLPISRRRLLLAVLVVAVGILLIVDTVACHPRRPGDRQPDVVGSQTPNVKAKTVAGLLSEGRLDEALAAAGQCSAGDRLPVAAAASALWRVEGKV